MFYPKCFIRGGEGEFFSLPFFNLNRSRFHTVLFHSFSTVWNMPLLKTGRLEQCRFVGLDCLVEDVYCQSEPGIKKSVDIW